MILKALKKGTGLKCDNWWGICERSKNSVDPRAKTWIGIHDGAQNLANTCLSDTNSSTTNPYLHLHVVIACSSFLMKNSKRKNEGNSWVAEDRTSCTNWFSGKLHAIHTKNYMLWSHKRIGWYSPLDGVWRVIYTYPIHWNALQLLRRLPKTRAFHLYCSTPSGLGVIPSLANLRELVPLYCNGIVSVECVAYPLPLSPSNYIAYG